MYVGCMIAQDTPSSLAELLIFDFVEGRSSAKKVPACKFFCSVALNWRSSVMQLFLAWTDPPLRQVQELSKGALDFARSCGGQPPEDGIMQRLSAIGTMGKHASNAERDLHFVLKQISLQVPVDKIKVRFQHPSSGEIRETDFPCILPEKFAAKLWQMGEDYFRFYFLANDETAARDLWRHVSARPWASGVDRNSKVVIPITLYGDEVYTYKATDCGVITVYAWSTDYLTCAHGPLDRYFLICAHSQYLEADVTWTDLSKQLAAHFTALCSQEWPWSHKYEFRFSSVTGDLKWLKDHFGVHNYRSNNFCSSCPCVKTAAAVEHTLSDFRESAPHRRVRYNHEHYLATTAEADRALLDFNMF